MKFTSSRRAASLNRLLILVMAERGLGKTEGASTFPGVVLLSTREGAAALDIDYQNDLKSLEEWRDAVATLKRAAEKATEKGIECPWKWVCLDEIGDLVDWCVDATLEKNGIPYLGHPKDDNKAMYKESRRRFVKEVIMPLRELRDLGIGVLCLSGEKTHPGKRGTDDPDRVGLEMSGSTEKEVRSFFDLVLRIESSDSGKYRKGASADNSADHRRILRFKPVTRDGVSVMCKARDPKGGGRWPEMEFITSPEGDSTLYPVLAEAFRAAYAQSEETAA